MHNNKGLSLVELLAAVAILGIIVVPLLHTFITSAGTASKSRELGAETLAAQNVAETVEATDLSDLQTLVSDQSSPPDKYVFRMNSGNYSATVTLTGTEYQNNTVYTPMDAVFTQVTQVGDDGLDPDKAAQEEFELEASAVSDAVESYDTARTIQINIDEKSGGAYEYSCKYKYTCSIVYTDENGVRQTSDLSPVEYPYVFYNGTYDAAKSQQLASLYFFFIPSSGDAIYDDTITITRSAESGTCTPVSVFLARQGTGDAAYKLLVQLKGDVASVESNTKVYCNVTNADFRVFNRKGVWYQKSVNPFGSLVATEKQYRRYDMTVDLYDKNNNKVYTLTGSKLG